PAWQPPADLRAVGAAAAAGRSPRTAAADEAGVPDDVPAPPAAAGNAPTPAPAAQVPAAVSPAPPVAVFEAASIVPEEYLPPGSRLAATPLPTSDGITPQVTTVGDPGYSTPALAGA